MIETFEILQNNSLFKNIDTDAIHNVLNCLEAKIETFQKNDIIYNYLDHVEYAGIILEGVVKTVMLNSNGSEYVVRHFETGEVFAEAYACTPEQKNIMQVISQKPSKILFLKLSNLLKPTSIGCVYASQVTANLLQNVVQKNIFQMKKLHIINQKKIREKLIALLIELRNDTNEVLLPFNRQGLADYLGVERSALSREMCKMQEENIIKFHKNRIIIVDQERFHIFFT